MVVESLCFLGMVVGVLGVVVVGVSSPTQVVVESGLRLVVCGVVV